MQTNYKGKHKSRKNEIACENELAELDLSDPMMDRMI